MGFFLTIGTSSTAFLSHLDTVGNSSNRIQKLRFGDFIHTDGNSILGADDRAGVTTLLYMIAHGVPGRYCLFYGEERGCIGSSKSAENEEFWKPITRAISFDREGYSNVITHQCMDRCCSDEFASTLANYLNRLGMNYSPDDSGVYTDSKEFTEIVPECTNLSVGYFGAHSNQERQDIVFLEQLCKACVKVDWESLPVLRDPSVVDCSYGSWDKWNPDDRYRSSEKETEWWRNWKPSRPTTWKQKGEIEHPAVFDPFRSIELALMFDSTPDASVVREAMALDPDRVFDLMVEYGLWSNNKMEDDG